MARQRIKPAGSKKATTTANTTDFTGPLPAPFKEIPEVLQPFVDTLDPRHVYIAHVDTKPASLKRNIFAVPVAMNLAIAALFCWRVYHIGPWYRDLALSMLGYPNHTTIDPSVLEWWEDLLPELALRVATIALDFLLFVFLWPWPLEFAMPSDDGNPIQWRWTVGFRDREVVVRRSRKWDRALGDIIGEDLNGRSLFMSHVSIATQPLLINEKSGYLLINAEWDLDWKAMVDATAMVDRRMAAIEAFSTVVLYHHDQRGWLTVSLKLANNAKEDDRRRQVFAFRDALSAIGKENLFYRWIEIVQFESSQPQGFGPEKQVKVAEQIRKMFDAEGIDFDKIWHETVGSPVMPTE